jgi:glyoxylase-like metal-dependent hydrolase (beta-lactamase superfamily II)
MRLGNLTLTLVDDGPFRLDGGAMFGVVPKVLWERHKPADDLNRISMVTNCALVETGSDLVLIDTGIGDKNGDQFAERFGMDPDAPRLPEQIVAAGYEPGDVTRVVLTHLHFDHCGWNATEDSGRLVPTFPNARYFLARGEVEHARNPNLRDRASYDPRNWEPLFDAGVVELFEDEIEAAPGVKAVVAPGHTENMAVVLLDGGDGPSEGEFSKAVFWADLVPTAAHVPFPWVMSYDLYPVTTLAQKQEWIPKAASEGWLSIFEHDPETPLARLTEDRPGRYAAEPVSP